MKIHHCRGFQVASESTSSTSKNLSFHFFMSLEAATNHFSFRVGRAGEREREREREGEWHKTFTQQFFFDKDHVGIICAASRLALRQITSSA